MAEQRLRVLNQHTGHAFALFVTGLYYLLRRIGASFPGRDVHRHEGLGNFDLIIEAHGALWSCSPSGGDTSKSATCIPSDFLDDLLARTPRVAQQRIPDFEFEFDVAATVNRVLQPRDFPGDRLRAGQGAMPGLAGAIPLVASARTRPPSLQLAVSLRPVVRYAEHLAV